MSTWKWFCESWCDASTWLPALPALSIYSESRNIWMFCKLWWKDFFFLYRKSFLKEVGTQGVWLEHCSRGINIYIRYIYIRQTNWGEKHNCWAKFLWVSISHSCCIVKVTSNVYSLTAKPKPWQYRPGLRKKDGFSVTGASDLGPV